jgi:hypothetical protein
MHHCAARPPKSLASGHETVRSISAQEEESWLLQAMASGWTNSASNAAACLQRK